MDHVEARDPSDPGAQALAVEGGACTLIGDQTTDVQAARAIGAVRIGYANKPGKTDDLAAAGADAVMAHIAELTEAIRS
ncbi:HAD hydrolase-like protein [Kribbella sp. NPDC004138]